MTRTEYGCQITAIIDEQTGGIEYPESFESEVSARFLRREPLEEAAAAILTDIISEAS